MAVKSLYFKNVIANAALSLQDGGTAPTAAITTTGWAVGKVAINNYSLMAAGIERTTANFSTTDALATPAFSAASCWRSEQPFNGTFANTNWTLAFRVRAVSAAAAQRGAVKVRLWKSAAADGTGAVQLTSAMLTGTTVAAALSTTASQTSTVTWTPGATTAFNNEYLWVQCEWQITTVGTNNSSDVDFYIELAGVITTPDFAPAITGTGTLTAKPLQHTNYIKQSEAFDLTSSWTVNDTVVTANTQTAPDSTLTADTVADNAANNQHRIYHNGTFAAPAGRVTFSVYAKAGTCSWIQMNAGGPSASTYANFNVANGTLGLKGDVGVVASITAVGDGWYRCAVGSDVPAGNCNPQIWLSPNDATGWTPIYVGSGSTIHLWGAQAEIGPLTDYIPNATGAPVEGPYPLIVGIGSVVSLPATGTGTLAAQASTTVCPGISQSFGTAVLTGGVSAIVGSGAAATVYSGPGVLNTGVAALVSAGVSRSVGTSGFLAPFGSALVSAGASRSQGTGALTSTATLAGTGAITLAPVVGGGTLGLVELGEGPVPILDLTVAGSGEARVSPVNMVSNASPSPYVVTSSNELAGYLGFNAFDGNPASCAHSNDALTTTAYWIKIDLGSARYVAGYKYQARDVGPYHCWKSWVLHGSNDDATWTLVDTVEGEPNFAISEIRSYVCDVPGVFRYWRWSVNASGGISGTYAEVGSLELWSGTSTFAESLSCLRASGAYEQNAAGVLTWRAANVLRVSDLGVLREDARTNWIDWSNDFTQGWWIKENSTITPNAAVAPDGTMTASILTDNATDYFHRCYVWSAAVTTEAGAASFSVYIKPGTHNGWVRIYGPAVTANINTATGTVGRVSGGYAYAEKLANGWCRVICVGATSAGAYQPQIVMAPGDLDFGTWPTYPGTGQTLYLWGAQSETGNRNYTYHATSYIPTNGAPATRQEDVIRLTGGAKQILTRTPGTVVVDFKTHHSDFNYAHIVSQGGGFFFWTGASGDDTVYLAWTAATNANVHMLTGAKAAAAWDIAGRYRYSAYGGEFGQTLDVDVSVTSDPWLGGGSFAGYFRRAAFWDRALPELDLRNLTAPGVATGPQLLSSLSGDGRAFTLYSGPGVLNAGTASLVGAGVTSSAGTGILTAATASAPGTGGSLSFGTATLTATAPTLSGRQADALMAQASTMTGAGLTQWVYSGPGVVPAQAATMVASGTSRSFGTGTQPAQAAAIVAPGVSRWIATGTLPAPTASVAGAGVVQSQGTGALTSVAQIAALGVSRSLGTGTAVSEVSQLEGYDQPAFLGGILVARKATMTGTGISSASGLGNLLPHMLAA